MKKNTRRILVILLIITLIGLFLPKTKKESDDAKTVDNIVGPSTFVVGSDNGGQGQAYGSIVATNGATITTSVGGVLQNLNCQPGTEVKKGDIIAQFTPASDLQTENMDIQRSFLGQQIGIYNSSLQAGLQNVDLQIANLISQKNTNEQQLALLKQNLDNLNKQQSLTTNDNQIQLNTLQTQLKNLKEQQVSDTAKTQNALRNQTQAAQTLAKGAITMVDNTFGVKDPYSVQDMNIYLGAKDHLNKEKVIANYDIIAGFVNSLTTVSADDASDALQEIADYFSLAAQVVNNSVSDLRYLPQTKIDTLFSTFNGTANGLIQAKTNFDTTNAANVSVRTTYDTQISSLENQIASLSGNKSQLSDIGLDSQKNSLQSQINSLQLSIDSFDNQLATLQNSKAIQTQSTNGQLLSVEQNLALLNNNLAGETLYSPIDGVIKNTSVVIGNKIGANIVVCNIGPRDVDGLKGQFFSAKNVALGSTVYIYDKSTLLGTGLVDFETPYLDAATQNKGYEVLTLNGTGFSEGQKVTFRFDNSAPTEDQIWVPLSYVTPKIDGYYVSKKTGDEAQEIKVTIGVINSDYIQILSGLQYNDVIVK